MNFLVYFVMGAMFLRPGTSLKCYSCSPEDKNCTDPYSAPASQLVQCSPNMHFHSNLHSIIDIKFKEPPTNWSCLKLKCPDTGIVGRECVPTAYIKDIYQRLDGNISDFCNGLTSCSLCENDGCNSSWSLQVSAILLSVLLLMVYSVSQ